MKHGLLNSILLVLLATFTAEALAKGSSLLDMSDQLDALDKQDFQESIDKANACTRARNFSCSESELTKAAKSANSGQDKKTLAAARQSIANEKARIAEEQRQRAEEERRVAEEERQRKEEEAREERRQERERQAREEEERRSAQATSDSGYAQAMNAVNDNLAFLAPIQNQTNKFLAEQAVRDRQAAEERNRVSAERDERAAEQRRDAEQDRAARAEAQRAARKDAARSASAENTRSSYGSSTTSGGSSSYSSGGNGSASTVNGSANASQSTQWRADSCGAANVNESGSFKIAYHDHWFSAGVAYQDANLGRCQTRQEIEAQAHSKAVNTVRSLKKSNGDPITSLTIAEERFVCDNNSYLKGWNCVDYITTKTPDGSYFVPSVLNNY